MHEEHRGSLLSWGTYEAVWAEADKLCWVCSMQLVIACSQQRIKLHTQKQRARHTVTIASKMSTRKHVFCGLKHPFGFRLDFTGRVSNEYCSSADTWLKANVLKAFL